MSSFVCRQLNGFNYCCPTFWLVGFFVLYTHLPYHKRLNNKDARRKTQEEDTGRNDAGRTSLEKYSPLTLLQGFERVVQDLHVRGCWRPNINFIFWPHCYDRHVVSLLFSQMLNQRSWGPLHRGFSEGPLGRVWPSLPHLVSGCLEFCWQLHRGFPRSPSVGCSLPYHISSLTLWESAGNCIGGFRGPPRSGVAFFTTSRLYRLEFYWQLLWHPKLNWVK